MIDPLPRQGEGALASPPRGEVARSAGGVPEPATS
jgi:hypothetical protein